mgnify:CR=1 FL=1
MRLKDKKITIWYFTKTHNEWNEVIEEWKPLPGAENIWAYVRHASGQEYFSAAQVQAKVEMIFEINWRDDIEPNMEIEYKGERYNITRIDTFEDYKDTIRIYAYKQ